MPTNVSRFEVLMYLAIGLEIFGSAFNFPRVSSHVGFASTLLTLVIGFGIRVLLIYPIARKQAAWARWVLLVLVVLGVLGVGIVIRNTPRT